MVFAYRLQKRCLVAASQLSDHLTFIVLLLPTMIALAFLNKIILYFPCDPTLDFFSSSINFWLAF